MRYITIICSAIVGAAILSSPAQAQQKTAKACEEEWRANKAENQVKKITEKAYVEKCRSAAASQAAPATAPAPAPKATAAPAAAPAAAPKSTAAPAAAPTGANQFATEAQAKGRCPTDTIVYVNLKSKIYHFAGHKDYGTLKKGTYMCEKDTPSAGARAAKGEKHP